METSPEQHVLKIPVHVFESANSKEDLEDWLMANDPVFIKEMRQLKAEALADKGRPLAEVTKKWDTKH